MKWIQKEEKEKGVILITFNRPDKSNALSCELIGELTAILKEQENKQRVLILTGSGSTFCSGLDLKETMDEMMHEKLARAMYHLLLTLYETSLITIAAVNGSAFAGGVGLIAACDFAIGSSEMVLGLPEVRRGIVPAQIMTLLRRKLSGRSLSELLLLGNTITAKRAVETQLLNKVVSHEEVMSSALDLAQEILRGGPHAVMRTKELMRKLHPHSLEKDLDVAFEYYMGSRRDLESHEGVQAFFEKRAPQWMPK